MDRKLTLVKGQVVSLSGQAQRYPLTEDWDAVAPEAIGF